MILPKVDVDRIHDVSIDVLEEVGIIIDHPEMKNKLLDQGCRMVNDRLCIPEVLVRSVVEAIPNEFSVYGRSIDTSRALGGEHQMAFVNTGIMPNVIDLDGDHVRQSALVDVEQTTRLLDAMENVDLVYSSLVDATDLLPHMTMPASFAAVIANTTKPLIGPGVTNRAEAQIVVDMARAVRGNGDLPLTKYPPCVPFITPISPLTFPLDMVQAIEVIAGAGLPLDVVANPVMGLTSPNTIAGAVLMGHAEVLAAAVIAHVVTPGLPILNHNTPSVADMRSLVSTTGGPETGLIRSTVAALSRKIGIPACVHGHSSSTFPDFQGGVEKSVNMLLLAQGEPAVLGGLGGTGNVTLGSYVAILLDNDIYGAIKRIKSGVAVDDDHLAFNVISDYAQEGDFIGSDHTLKHLSSGEVWQPALAIREGLRGGAQPDRLMVDNAREKARDLLTSYEVDPLEERIQRDIDVILLEYEKSHQN